MKVYISVDMEGVACVTHTDQIKREGTEYEMARKWLTAKVNAAIEGALGAGATEVVVADSHNRMRNLLPDELHEDALLVGVSGNPVGHRDRRGRWSEYTRACRGASNQRVGGASQDRSGECAVDKGARFRYCCESAWCYRCTHPPATHPAELYRANHRH